LKSRHKSGVPGRAVTVAISCINDEISTNDATPDARRKRRRPHRIPGGFPVTTRIPHRARVGALLLILFVGAAGCGSRDGGTTAAAGAAGAVAAKGAPAPDFTLQKVGGGTIHLADLRGHAVIVDFWDTWCPPCRKALPDLQALDDEFGDRLTVVGVAFGRDGKDAVAKFLADRNLTFPCALMDPDYATARAYGGLQSIPTTFLIDPEGVVRDIWVGGYDKAVYETAVKQVLVGA